MRITPPGSPSASRSVRVPRITALLALILLSVLYGCDFSPLEHEAPVLLEGSLIPTDPETPIGGSAAAATQFGSTEVSILALGLPPGELHAWHLRRGPCAGEGDPLVSPQVFPPLDPDEDGEANARAEFSIPLVSEQEYAVEVIDPAAGGLGVIACADMT